MSKKSGLTVIAICAGFFPAAAQLSAQTQKLPKDLKVRIVIEISPGTYAPLSVPAGTIVSVNAVTPPTPPSIISCPSTAGVAMVGTPDCFEIGLASNTSIKLQVAPMSPNGAVAPHAHFDKWMDIPGSSGLPIGSACTASSYMPNIKCSMAGARYIQAVFTCDRPKPPATASYSYNAKTKQCQGVDQPAACAHTYPDRTLCYLGLQIKRAKTGPYDDIVTVTPGISPSVNTLPSNETICKNTSGGNLQTNCSFFYPTYPTTVTLTASSSSGTAPIGFSWGPGVCASFGSALTCTYTVNPSTLPNVVAKFAQ